MNKVEYETEGVIFSIQRYSLHGGPDIRTIPFSKGCSLSCRWCSSPESQRHNPELLFKKNDCIRRGKYIDARPQQALSTTSTQFINHDHYTQCGKCTEICPTRALEMKSKRISVTAVICELEKEENLYRRSDGGITLSGDEPLAQPEFVCRLLKACKAKGWHTAIEASGFTIKAVINKVFPHVDLTLADIKAVDSKIRERNTGMNNRVILENPLCIFFLTKVVVRIPMIPGVNDNSQEIHNIVEFAYLIQNVDTIHLLPCHGFGENKYNLLGRQYPMGGTKSIEEAQMAGLKAMVESLGFNCRIGG